MGKECDDWNEYLSVVVKLSGCHWPEKFIWSFLTNFRNKPVGISCCEDLLLIARVNSHVEARVLRMFVLLNHL